MNVINETLSSMNENHLKTLFLLFILNLRSHDISVEFLNLIKQTYNFQSDFSNHSYHRVLYIYIFLKS